jgi:DNA repair protein RecO (recombination protein O)
MATLYQTTGIVLGWRAYREHDRWYSALTKDKGKIDFLARGGQKHLAKLTPHLEMVSEANFLFVDGRLYHTVAGVERLVSFPNIYNSLSKLLLLKNSLTLINMGTRQEESDPVLYGFLKDWLVFLDGLSEVSTNRAAFILGAFSLKFMSIIGYRPELNCCLGCRKIIEPNRFKWHALKGGVVCSSCIAKHGDQWFSAKPISDGALKLLRFALQEKFTDQTKPYLKGEDVAEFHAALESLIISHFPTIPAASIKEACAYC